MTILVAIGAGGVGAVCRHFAVRRLARALPTELPLGLVVVNCTGALVLGIVMGAAPDATVTATAAGFLGGFTTFSSWMADTSMLLSTRGARRIGAVNLVLMLGGGLVLGFAGYALAS